MAFALPSKVFAASCTRPSTRPIALLVEALQADPRIVTKGSCWGHGKKPAYVDLAVEGMGGLRV